jgi:poly(3-hydroxybutyrate) depolymerase
MVALAVLVLTALTLTGRLGGSASADVRPLAATAGCGRAPALTSGTHSIQSSGQNRSYILRVPANYDTNHPYRLIFGFHWVGGTANDVDSGGTDGYNWSYYGLRRLADNANNSTIFVAPQGISNGWANSGGQDVTFVDDILNQLDNSLCVDTTQIFSTGFSYGAAMTYALACARPTTFRAVAVYSGANLSGCTGGTQPVAYIGLHGLRDNVLPIASGRALRDTFVRNNGCTPQNPPEPASGSLTHIVTTYTGCRAGYPVVWAAFDGAGHDPGPIDGCTCDGWKTWTKDLVWSFFTQFQSNTPPSSSSPSSSPSQTPSSPVPGGCAAAVSNDAWNGGFVTTVRVTAGSSAIKGWSVSVPIPSGSAVTSSWNTQASGSTGTVRFANVSYNGQLSAGGSTEFGFQGTGSPPTSATCTAS